MDDKFLDRVTALTAARSALISRTYSGPMSISCSSVSSQYFNGCLVGSALVAHSLASEMTEEDKTR